MRKKKYLLSWNITTKEWNAQISNTDKFLKKKRKKGKLNTKEIQLALSQAWGIYSDQHEDLYLQAEDYPFYSFF